MTDKSAPVLYDASGREIKTSVKGHRPTMRSVGHASSFHDMSSWYMSLSSLNQGGAIRARDPFGNHPWVYAAAMVTAIVASQAPFTIFTEQEELITQRKATMLRAGRLWRGGGRGTFRRAVQRHLQKPTWSRMIARGLDRDYEHPLMNVLLRPNPLQTGIQFWQLTHLWNALRGECFWVGEMEDGSSIPPGMIPERIWVLSPDLFEPILENGSFGELIGWYFCPPPYMRKRGQGFRLPLPLNDVVQHKMPNPVNPLRGLSPIAAAAMNITLDLMAKDFNRSILTNGGDPGGILLYDSDMSREEEAEYIEKWESIHKGAENARRTALLSGGFKYQSVAMSPSDLQFLEMMKWGREEVLAVMGVPPAILGATQFTNYATALAQDHTFWDKRILSLLRMEEDTVDGSLLYHEPDTVFGAFDLRGIDALRSGLDDKIRLADQMCGQNLHMPPTTSFELVGIECPSYLGDSTNMSPMMVTPLRDILLPPPPEPVMDPLAEPTVEEPTVEEPTVEEPDSDSVMDLFKMLVVRGSRHAAFIEVQERVEAKFSKSYRQWISFERDEILRWFDEATAEKALRLLSRPTLRVGENLIAQLPSTKLSKDRLKAKTRPVYTTALDSTYKFTLGDLGGLPVFDIDDPRILDFFDKREKVFVNATPETVRKNLVTSLQKGLTEGESIQQLRVRVGQVYDVSASSSKALTIARTESGSFMNGVRDVMFEASGFEQEEWSTSGDEHVRESHVIFGDSGPQPRNTNYLELVGKGSAGVLAYPGDVRCGALEELLNCRCIKIPVLKR